MLSEIIIYLLNSLQIRVLEEYTHTHTNQAKGKVTGEHTYIYTNLNTLSNLLFPVPSTCKQNSIEIQTMASYLFPLRLVWCICEADNYKENSNLWFPGE